MPPVTSFVVAIVLVVLFFALPQRQTGERAREKRLKSTDARKPWRHDR